MGVCGYKNWIKLRPLWGKSGLCSLNCVGTWWLISAVKQLLRVNPRLNVPQWDLPVSGFYKAACWILTPHVLVVARDDREQSNFTEREVAIMLIATLSEIGQSPFLKSDHSIISHSGVVHCACAANPSLRPISFLFCPFLLLNHLLYLLHVLFFLLLLSSLSYILCYQSDDKQFNRRSN